MNLSWNKIGTDPLPLELASYPMTVFPTILCVSPLGIAEWDLRRYLIVYTCMAQFHAKPSEVKSLKP
jgi:hypothetical protein